jgi:S-DNA-T family DNA segregation ATPase FtsK/SpoIIIE
MAKRRRSKKKSKSWGERLGEFFAMLVRPEVVGSVLIMLSVFTLLSLITDSHGSLTGAWIGALEAAFGVGAYGFPLVTGALGLWMVIHAIERMPDLPWQRPAGFALLFLAFITGAALLVPENSMANGGWLGDLVGSVLSDTVTPIGGWAFVTFIAIGGILLLTDRILIDGVLDVWDAIRGEGVGRPAQEGLPQPPPVPLASGEISWWKRLRERMAGVKPGGAASNNDDHAGRALDDNMVPADPNARRTPAASRQPTSKAPPPPRAELTTPQEEDVLTPHIVGDQEWRLPDRNRILQDWERFADSDDRIREQGRLIQETLASFGVPADFEGAYKGPAVTQYLIKPGYIERTVKGEVKRTKVKISKIQGLSNDLALALAAPSVRIEAPIPGTTYVGVEVPNSTNNVVGLKELMESDAFQGRKGKLLIALGEDVKGQPIVTDLTRMPHLLIAGATGSGKSVAINSIITCLLLTHTPDSLRFLMVDPKMVELSVYNGIPHLLTPVVTEVDKAAGVLFWAVKEMERRYKLLSKANARDLERFNAWLRKRGEKPLPYIVMVVDEMADLMMAAPEEVEKHVCRLAQMARAVGMHLIIATQRPSVDVITGLIKANFPARIAFAVTSQIDSRVILDTPGAERLLGRGDMLFMAPDTSKLERLQGTYLNDEEIARIVRYWKGARSLEHAPAPRAPNFNAEERAGAGVTPDTPRPVDTEPSLAPHIQTNPQAEKAVQTPLFEQIEAMKSVDARDALFDDAVNVVRQAGRGSVSLLQRKLRVGYSRASRLVEQLEEAGVLGPDQGGSRGRAYLGDDALREKATPRPPAASPAPRVVGGDEDEEPPISQIWIS